MVQDTESQLGNVEQIQLRDGQIMNQAPFGLLHAIGESLTG